MNDNNFIMTIEQLFFELIQVSLGTRICLSHTPSADEWGELYGMAKKQSLVGVCFAGVQKLQTQQQEPPEMTYLTWMGMAAKIQQRNEVVYRQCVDLQKRLSADGLRSSILKGQGIASLYHSNSSNLSLLRQSGDIDVFVHGGMEKVLGYCTEMFGKVEWDYINAHAPFYSDTEVELHWRAQAMTNLCVNKKLQRWLEKSETQEMMLGGTAKFADGSELIVPTAEFNAFYILLHCYHHMFESGLGLRQLMDYYFVLNGLDKKACGEKAVLTKTEKTADPVSSGSANLGNADSSSEIVSALPSSAAKSSLDACGIEETASAKNKKNITELFEQFGMMRFAKGVMWIMQEVFKLERECMICEPDEREGRFLLKEVMQNGNFGHHDERVKKVGSGKMSELWRNVQHNWHLASHYPSEFFWQPVWLAYHFCWKRCQR